ncbi:MAG TPA: alpha-amylase family glycosyl hydrolase, partial [Kribbella sp.]|nr:alpha-amylase family glycosyl hydrolase [Kribbella sp.]
DIAKTVRHWLDHGADGFRVDAVPHMVRQAAVTDDRDDGFWFLTELAEYADGAPLMGEVDSEPAAYGNYFGNGDRLQGILDFWTNNLLFLALARGAAEPLYRAMRKQPAPPDGCTYLNWLRNQDELNLALLADDERAEVMAAFAPDENMRVYGRGIRRRIAPMLNFDLRRIAMAHALVMSLPGVPIIRYGEELGMDEDLSLPERDPVRLPMDWAAAERQQLEPGSLLSRVAQQAHIRRGLGPLPPRHAEPVPLADPSIFAVRHRRQDDAVLMLANLSDHQVDLHLDHEADLLADQPYEPSTPNLTLGPYGYRWLRVK